LRPKFDIRLTICAGRFETLINKELFTKACEMYLIGSERHWFSEGNGSTQRGSLGTKDLARRQLVSRWKIPGGRYLGATPTDSIAHVIPDTPLQHISHRILPYYYSPRTSRDWFHVSPEVHFTKETDPRHLENLDLTRRYSNSQPSHVPFTILTNGSAKH
jgi:hypothetical protein